MNKQVLIGVLAGVAGFAAGVTAAVVATTEVYKIAKEIREDLCEETFTSPDGTNTVTVAFGASNRAKGLTMIKVLATSTQKDDDCKLITFARKSAELLSGEWSDENHFTLLIGSGKRKQYCDVSFDGDQIVTRYSLAKIEL